MSPDANAPARSREEVLLQQWMVVSLVLYGATMAVFLVVPGLLFQGLNIAGQVLGLPDAPEPTERFWFALTISMMAMLCVCCWQVRKDVRRNADFCLPIVVGKFSGAVVGLAAFVLWGRYLAHAIIAVTDLPLGIVTLVLWRRARRAAG